MGMPIHACTDSKGFCDLFLPNTTHETIHLARSEVVGSADNHAMWDRAPLTSQVAAVIFKHHHRYTDLLTKYADVFTNSPLDLGLTDTVIHDIQLRDREPVYTKQFPLQ